MLPHEHRVLGVAPARDERVHAVAGRVHPVDDVARAVRDRLHRGEVEPRQLVVVLYRAGLGHLHHAAAYLNVNERMGGVEGQQGDFGVEPHV